jgi:putative transposase
MRNWLISAVRMRCCGGSVRFKKNREHLLATPALKYRFVQEQREQCACFGIREMCRVLDVSASGYYRWCLQPVSERTRQDQKLTEHIRTVYQESDATYGSPRIHHDLREQGIRCSRKRVARLIRQNQLRASHSKRFVVTTQCNPAYPVAPNLLDRCYQVEEVTDLNRVWAGDITYIATAEGWLYLGVVLDLKSRRVVGWQMSHSLELSLVTGAFEMAVQQRHPQAGLLHHSDRGSQYASHSYQDCLAERGIVCSMSRKGNCWDNAPVESFFATPKKELVHRQSYQTRREAWASLFRYIEVFYNRRRRHSSLGYLSPCEYERRWQQQGQERLTKAA